MDKLIWSNVQIKLDDLLAWNQNPRFSTKAQAQRLINSWKALGQFQTIAIGPPEGDPPAHPVYDGHQRLSALLTLYDVDYTIDARQASRSLDDAERRALTLAANLAVGQWNWDQLASWPEQTLTEWGMDGEQLKALNNDANNLKEMLRAHETSFEEKSLAEQFLILIECADEVEQLVLFKEFSEKGLRCRALIS